VLKAGPQDEHAQSGGIRQKVVLEVDEGGFPVQRKIADMMNPALLSPLGGTAGAEDRVDPTRVTAYQSRLLEG
jgi:hypothetical protein